MTCSRLRRIFPATLVVVCSLVGGSVARAADPKPAADQGVHWRYAQAPAFEILSSCSDEKTKVFMARVYRALPLMELPPEFQPIPSRPIQLILDGHYLADELAPADAPVALRAMRVGRRSSIESWSAEGPDGLVFRVALRDWLHRESEMEISSLPLWMTPFIIRQKMPDAPPWLHAGFAGLYTDDTQTAFIHRGVLRLTPPKTRLEPILDASRRPERLMALPLFFAEQAPPTNPAELARWRAQATLFVHWGLYRSGASVEKFWDFCLQAHRGVVTEALFQRAFGMDFAGATKSVSRHVSVAFSDNLTLRPKRIRELPEFELRDATPAERSRIEGEWLRLTARELKPTHPALSATYLRHAGRTLQGAPKAREQDALLLAALALYHVDAGDASSALPLLQKAQELHVARPSALRELGALLLAGARAAPAGEAGKLSLAQTSAALRPLYAARAQPPPDAATNELIVDLWLASEASPTLAQLQDLRQGIRPFPRQGSLNVKLADLAGKSAQPQLAAEIAEAGLQFTSDQPTRERLEQLRALRPLSVER